MLLEKLLLLLYDQHTTFSAVETKNGQSQI